MAELPADLSARLAKLLPRLAINHDGEVVATVTAIAGTLPTSGHDLHDLAEHVAVPARVVIVCRDRTNTVDPSPADPKETIAWCLGEGLERCPNGNARSFDR